MKVSALCSGHFLWIFALALALPLTACSAPRTMDGPTASPNLEKFYGQALNWGTCASFSVDSEEAQYYSDPRFDCGYLQVPIDYTRPAGETAQLAVLRQKATGPRDQRIGSLLINPGGPGSSGTEAAIGVSRLAAGQPVTERFDLIGFDPRGVGASKPAIQCFTPAERDADRLDVELDNSPAGVARQEAKSKDYAAKCERRSGKELLANAGTRDTAKDMDILRAVLGDQKLTYLGYSAGTRLGYTYAEQFPQNVRALVLDGVIDPAQSDIDRDVAQGAGFQRAFDDFAVWCAKQQQCPLGPDPKNALGVYRKLVEPTEKNAVPLSDGRKMSYNDVREGTAAALYTPQYWNALRRGLLELSNAHGETLMLLADSYESRDQAGNYQFSLDAFASISCVDEKPVTDPAVALERDKRFRAAAPFEDDGHGPDPARDACAFWPVPNTSEPHVPHVPGLPQLLVISVTHDPATPYQAGVNLAKALNSRLLTVEGTKHTIALQGTPCVDELVNKYLIDLALASEGAHCTLEPN